MLTFPDTLGIKDGLGIIYDVINVLILDKSCMRDLFPYLFDPMS